MVASTASSSEACRSCSGHLLRHAQALDRDTRLRGDGAQAEEIRIFVGFGSMLCAESTPSTRSPDRSDQTPDWGVTKSPPRCRRGGGPAVPRGPPADEPGRARSNHFAREALASGNEPPECSTPRSIWRTTCTVSLASS